MPDRAVALAAMRQTRQVLQEELDALLQEKRRVQTRASAAYAAIVRRPRGATIEVHITELEELRAKQARMRVDERAIRSQIRALDQQIRRDEGRRIRKGGASR